MTMTEQLDQLDRIHELERENERLKRELEERKNREVLIYHHLRFGRTLSAFRFLEIHNKPETEEWEPLPVLLGRGLR